LEMGFNIQSGWNLGGPRVTPDYAAKQITYSQTFISGEKNISIKLEAPDSRLNFYKDIAVLAFPVNDEQKTEDYITNLDFKLGYHELGGSAPDTRFLLSNSLQINKIQEKQSSYIVGKKDILELTSHMDDEGNLNWNVPDNGKWCIIRIGYTCTDSHV